MLSNVTYKAQFLATNYMNCQPPVLSIFLSSFEISFYTTYKIKGQNILIKIEENGNSLEFSKKQHKWPWSRQNFGFERNCRLKLGFSCFQSNEAAWNSRQNTRSFHKRKGKITIMTEMIRWKYFKKQQWSGTEMILVYFLRIWKKFFQPKLQMI